ncbi:MAG TPA: hypothetical protein VN663_02675 [Ramlibacter sp.]|nr:hypothetical protein [Ramlibacter sp.]
MAAVQSISTTASLHVAQLWRYPVKSLLGERMPTLRLIDDGVEGESPDSIVYNAPDTVPK